jgi:uncharacterized protein
MMRPMHLTNCLFETNLMNDTENLKPNRLLDETSPYLQQHAYNPVDWYPWSDEAIQKSKTEDKPIFLSIGYSACHWCHVMEHESFENAQIAQYMSQHFVCIKVDREERPDLDSIYMNSVQLLTGHGGWPMSVFLTPELKPFFGGTYWPPFARMKMPGFFNVLNSVNEAWREKRESLEEQAESLTQAVIQVSGIQSEPSELSLETMQLAQVNLLAAADNHNGGFGSAPKFPHPMTVRVLLRNWKRFGDAESLDVVKLTLDKMADGGIYDHLGGGFARYSTDGHWLVPHFEKMLYDNALLIPAYLEGLQATGNQRYASVVRETCDYVLREMTQPEGGFYSTQDADSDGVEGKFFVWSLDEVNELLDDDEAKALATCYDVTKQGNWEGKNILNRPKSFDEYCETLELARSELDDLLASAKRKLFDARSKRIWPGRDDKVLASWNGMMIAAMSQAAMVLDEPKYAQAASDAAIFVLEVMRESDGRLLHAYKDGRARFNGYLDDYSCMIDGLVELFQAGGDVKFRDAAVELSNRMNDQFGDTDEGGFFYTASDHEELIARSKDSQDNATPSGNGMAAYALLRLGRLTADATITEAGLATLQALSGNIKRSAMASAQALLALDFRLGPSWELHLVNGPDENHNKQAKQAIHESFIPNRIVWPDSESLPASFGEWPVSFDDVTLLACEQGTCRLPASGIDAIKESLNTMS